MTAFRTVAAVSAACVALACAGSARAEDKPMFDSGKLLLTGGVTSVEGSGGGGIASWATITGYETEDSIGANVHATGVDLPDYQFRAYGAAVGFYDRVELSYTRQAFDTGNTGALLGLGRGFTFHQDVVGAKVRLIGDAVYDQDLPLPQISIGVLHKRNKGIGGLGALGVSKVTQLGAARASGTDVYLAATKLYLDSSLLLNGTVRATKANQMGLLGFGGDKGDSYEAMLEASAAYLVDRRFVAGVEYRMKPRNLGVDNEKAYYDVFAAWFPSKYVSVTAAYAVLGDITVFNPTRQRGAYLSVQTGF